MWNKVLHIKLAILYVWFVIWCSYMYPKMQYEVLYNGQPEWAGYVLFFWEMSLCALWAASTVKIHDPCLRAALGGSAFEIAGFNVIMLYFKTLNYDIVEFYWTLLFIAPLSVYTFYQIKLNFTNRYDLLTYIIRKLF